MCIRDSPTDEWLILNVSWRSGRHTFNFGAKDMAPKLGYLLKGDEGTWTAGGVGLRAAGAGRVTVDTLMTSP